jgi:hypothetical protein
MADYREMYRHLFRETTKAIELLQEAQRYCEERYLEGEEKEIVPLRGEDPS